MIIFGKFYAANLFLDVFLGENSSTFND